ncbi:hypothetical protein ACHAQA_000498 [Verticillium albo-atrum]
MWLIPIVPATDLPRLASPRPVPNDRKANSTPPTMLRRPATTLTITSEDVASYEDRRIREHDAAEARRVAALNKAHYQRQQAQLQAQAQLQLQAQAQAHAQAQAQAQAQYHSQDPNQQSPYPPQTQSPYQPQTQSPYHERHHHQLHHQQQQQQQQQRQARELMPPPQPQFEQSYTEQDTEMLVGSSDDDEEDEEGMGPADGSVRGRGLRGGRGRGAAGVMLTPTPGPEGMARGARTREDRIGLGRRGR